ncbi:MAG: hypothetical protein JWR90_619 [Marmoricola sp.]|jgi:hypothetical protein|nr:hypothetical protein [Marmoricola sp.]
MRLLIAILLMAALTACSDGSNDGPSPSAHATRKPSPSAPESPSPAQPDASGTKACAEVRAGIDAFNAHEYASTVAHFKLALPLAKSQFRAKPAGAAEDLVEAVTYYAVLAPEDYPVSALSSSQFAKYKAITLGQCAPVGGPPLGGSTEAPGVPA